MVEEPPDALRLHMSVAENDVEAALMTFWRGFKILLWDSEPGKTVSVDPQKIVALLNLEATAGAIFYAFNKRVSERDHVSGTFTADSGTAGVLSGSLSPNDEYGAMCRVPTPTPKML